MSKTRRHSSGGSVCSTGAPAAAILGWISIVGSNFVIRSRLNNFILYYARLLPKIGPSNVAPIDVIS